MMYPSNMKVRECIHKIANCFPHSTVLVYGSSGSPGCHWPHIVRAIPSVSCFEQFSFTSHLMDCQYGPDEEFDIHPLFFLSKGGHAGKVVFITLDNPDSTSITVLLER